MKLQYQYLIVVFFGIAIAAISSPMYADTMCTDSSTTSSSGTLYDSGGASGNYSSNENCSFLIQPAGGGSITLSFSTFEYEYNYDNLYVYDGTNNNGTLLGRFTGSVLPQDLTASSGAMYIIHVSDNIITDSGFSATWIQATDTVEPAGSVSLLFSDDFESGLHQWTQSDASYSGIGSHTYNSAISSLFLHNSANTVTSRTIDADVFEATLSVWVRKGADAFSEDPISGEDLTLSYLNSSNQWVVLETFLGGSVDGEIFNVSYQLPRVALHSNLQLRFSLLDGSGYNRDYWHVDDVELLASTQNFTCDQPVIFEDDFESGTSQWVLSDNTYVGTGTQTANSGSQSLYLHDDTSDITSLAVDSSTGDEATLSFWLRRGDDSFSEDPDTNENLELYYLNDSNSWVLLDIFLGNGTPGEIISSSYSLPLDALHANFKIRFHLTKGSGSDNDYWHIDDVQISLISCEVVPDVDRLVIIHDQSATYCLAEPMTVTAYNSLSEVVGTYSGTIILDTQTGSGTWSLSSGSGAFIDSVADDGLASYTFSESDNGTATFALSYRQGAATINVDAYDSSIRDDDTEGDLLFSATGFSVTAAALTNPPTLPISNTIATQTSGEAFTLHLAAYGADADSGECSIIETYTGNKTINVSAQYIDPAVGGLMPLGSGSMTFTNGQANFSSRYDDVGKIIINVSDTDAGINGNTSEFVVKPAGFSITVVDNPATTDSGSGFSIAGAPFTVNVQSLNSQGNVTPNYGNELIAESVKVAIDSLVFPIGGDIGLLNNASQFIKGSGSELNTFKNTAITWSEVGSIRLIASVADNDYLGVGNITSSPSDTIGRFYPDKFKLSSPQIIDAHSTFTYFSQPQLTVSYELQLPKITIQV